ncbi:MAG: SAM-dependent methyltransferase [bacterium]
MTESRNKEQFITPPGNPELVSRIAESIRTADGRITFERFMEMALYHPGLGYYVNRPPIGHNGDFFTNVSVGDLYGRILARQFLHYRESLGNPPGFRVVEFGGLRGQLREDILREAPELDYTIIEAGEEPPDHITGCVFSNELLDAFPVHRVRVVKGKWQELYVIEGGEGDHTFSEIPGELSTPRLAERLEGLPAHLMEGYTTEINIRATDWIRGIARRLDQGYVVTVDYGYDHDGYFAPHRRDGTLLCHYQHTANRDPFARIGQQDITAHVEFTSVMEAGQHAGLETVMFCDQSQFLLECGQDLLEEIATRDAGRWSPDRNRLHQLIHPAFMGRTFKALIQRKDCGQAGT